MFAEGPSLVIEVGEYTVRGRSRPCNRVPIMKSHAVPRCRPTSLALLLSLAVAALAMPPAPAGAQALPGLSSLRVAYNTRKATANPQGEL